MRTNSQAKRILMYGDSLVYGKIPGGVRYDAATRFTGQLQNILGNDYDIIEEGLRGRMLSGENTYFPHRNGLEQFGPILASHMPLDLVVIFLGTNDMNSGQDKTYEDMNGGLTGYIETIARWCEHFNFPKPKLLLVSPPLVHEEFSHTLFKDIFTGAEPKSQALGGRYEKMSQELHLEFINLAGLVSPSQIDGIHLNEQENKIVAQVLAPKIQSLI